MADSTPAPLDDAPPAPAPAGPACRFLRNKGMYVYTDMGDQAHHDSDSTAYWCLKSMTSFGPDDEPANGCDCRNPERSCYQPI